VRTGAAFTLIGLGISAAIAIARMPDISDPGPRAAGAAAPAATVRVLAATSLAPAFRALGNELAAAGLRVEVEVGGSRMLARRLADLPTACDVIAVADASIFGAWSLPAGDIVRYEVFASDRLVLAHGQDAPALDLARAGRWWDALLRPGVRFGHAAPDVAPAGYRALLCWQLAERELRRPGLADRLRDACPPGHTRPSLAALAALVTTGELDYAFLYASTAQAAGLGVIELGPSLDFSDPARDAWYAGAETDLAGRTPAERTTLRGSAIRYAIAVTTRTGRPEAAQSFVEAVKGPRGRALLAAHGLRHANR
jgi:molybdate/tungstate transport system substrate-binding protein